MAGDGLLVAMTAADEFPGFAEPVPGLIFVVVG